MKRRLQDISSERVIAELAGTSFMTETGKVIEGNYQVGDIAPVVFDRHSKRYLAVWKTRRDEPIKFQKIEDELPSVTVLSASFVLAKFVLSEWKIFFTVLGEDPLTSTKHRYIDLSTIHDTLTIGMFLNPYVLRLIEDRAYLGALILFDKDPYKSNMSEDITSGVVIKFKVGTKIAPAVSVTYGGYKYWKYEFDYRFITFGTMDDDLVDVIPDFDIQAGHPGSLGQDSYDSFGDVSAGAYPCRAWRNPWPGDPLILNETSPYNWSGSATAGWDLPNDGGHVDVQFIDNITVTQTSTKKGISKMVTDAQIPFVSEYGREIKPIGAMVWCADENLDNLNWEIQFSARVEYDIDLTLQQTTGYIPHTLHADCGDIELGYAEFAPFKQKTFIVAIPFILRRDKNGWTAEDHQGLVGHSLCLETRGFYVDPFGYARPRAVLFRLDSPGVIQERITVHEFINTLTERWFLPNQVAGRYRKAWGIPVGETRSKPKLLLDHTTVDYSLWSQDWQGFGGTSIDQFVVNTFLSLDNQAFELVLAVNQEDKWSYRCVQWPYYSTPELPFPPIVYSCLDYHSLPPVKVEENNIYYVPITTYDPYWLNAKPQRTDYKHQGGGSAVGVGIEMCRVCPVKSGPHDRSVYKIGSSVYDYNQNVPGIPQGRRVSRQLLSWLSMSGQIPKIDSAIDLDGSSVVTLKHLTDPSKDLTANDVAFSTFGGEVCDAGALLATA
jgi:hypothetical protein